MPTKPTGRFVLGLSDDYLGSVTLLHGGHPVFAVANERKTRKKGDAGFPEAALQAALSHAGIRRDELHQVVVANRTHFVYRLLQQHFDDYEHDFFNVKQKLYLKYHDLVRASRIVATAARELNGLLMMRQLARRVQFCDHHLAHALSAIYSSPFDECLAVSIDNLGDGYSTKVHGYRGGRIDFHWGSRASVSPGQFYGEITQLLGFNPLRHAGKLTGLAALGDPEPAYALMEQLFGLTDDKMDFRMMPSHLRWRRRGVFWQLALFPREEVAAAAQRRLEDVVVEYVRHALRTTGHRRLALAGGVFANVKLNLALRDLPEVEALHVHPAMSDEGLATGAAALALLQSGELMDHRMESIYLGSGFDDARIRAALEGSPLRFATPRDLPETAARLLTNGHILARFDGRSEYGPRALGNRSILCRADDPSVNDWLNTRLNRSEFMPFAPVTCQEDAAACYEDMEGAADTARHMTIAFRCTPLLRRSCPGVVHVDGTARPQLIRREDNPDYHRIVRRFHELTGMPALINTSFNMHEEPIVDSPENAVRSFLDAKLDFLAIGEHLAMHPARTDLDKEWSDVCARSE